MKKLLICLSVLVFLVVVLYGLAYFNAETVNRYLNENDAKAAVLANLKDPDSAQFRNLNGYCGEVNSKNSAGGYSGFERFVAIGSKVYFESQDRLFESTWESACDNN